MCRVVGYAGSRTLARAGATVQKVGRASAKRLEDHGRIVLQALCLMMPLRLRGVRYYSAGSTLTTTASVCCEPWAALMGFAC